MSWPTFSRDFYSFGKHKSKTEIEDFACKVKALQTFIA